MKGKIEGFGRGPRSDSGVKGNKAGLENKGCSSPVSRFSEVLGRQQSRTNLYPSPPLHHGCSSARFPARSEILQRTPVFATPAGAEGECKDLRCLPQRSTVRSKQQKRPQEQHHVASRKHTVQMMQSEPKTAWQRFHSENASKHPSWFK